MFYNFQKRKYKMVSIQGFLKNNNAKKMTLAAYFLSAWYRLTILTVKPKYLQKYWGEHGKESPETDTVANYRYSYRVARVVNRICNKTKWESKCLVRALTAQALLKRRGIHSTMYLGCGIQDGKMVAHAWLRVGEIYVTGGNGSEYSIVDKFYT